MPDSADVGRRVLAALDAGRATAIRRARERGARTLLLVAELAVLDARGGRPIRGRAGRIARKLGGLLSASQVRKKLRALSSVRDSAGDDDAHRITDAEACPTIGN